MIALPISPTRWSHLRVGLSVGVFWLMALVWLLPTSLVVGIAVGVIVLALVLRYPVVGLALIGLSVPWSSALHVPLAPAALSTTDLLAGLVTGVWLCAAAVERRRPLQSLWTPYVGLYLGAIALSVTQAVDLGSAGREVLKWLEMGLIYEAGAYFLSSQRSIRTLVPTLVLGGASQALLGLAQIALAAGPAAFSLHRTFLRAYGTFDQPNPFAGYLNMILPLAVVMALHGTEGRKRWGYGLCAAAIAAALLASQSRGGLIAGAFAVLLVLGRLHRGVTRALLVAGVAAVDFALLAAFNLVPLGPAERVLSAIGLGNVSFGEVNDANFSAVERAAHWLAGVRMFVAHPLAGVGIGNYGAAYPAYHPRGWYASLEHAHNYYINIAAEAGILGLTAYALLVGSALWYSYRACAAQDNRFCGAVVLGVFGALAATSIHNLFDVLYVHGMAALVGLLMALVPACANQTVCAAGPQTYSSETGMTYS